MPVIDLSAYKPVPATLGDANQIANGMQAIQNVVNALDNNNFAAGKIFDPLKLMQDGAVDGDAMVWSTAANAGAGGWVPSTTRKMLRTGLARDYTEVTKSAVQSISNATFTAVTFNTETADDSNLHDNVTNNTRLTIPSAGLWLFGAWVEWVANGSGGRQAGLTLNSGTSLVAIDVPAGGQAFSANGGPLVATHVCAVNDFVELFVYQSSGGALNVNPTTTRLWAVRL